MRGDLGCQRYAVKSQILAGDRGATGGIAFATTPAEVAKKAAQLLGKRLVTSQTGPAGAIVHQVYVEEAIDAAQQLYAAVTLDGVAGRVVLLASPSGGEDIETRAASDPAAIRRLPVKLAGGKPEADFEKLAGEITGAPTLAASSPPFCATSPWRSSRSMRPRSRSTRSRSHRRAG